MKFSEGFMEDCIAENPSAFLPFNADLVARQVTIGGFRPDLIVRSEEGKSFIIEIQQSALDRTHLYKCLEYRDLYALEYQDLGAEVLLFCERLPDRFKPILETHNILAIIVERDDFISKAVDHCPFALKKHLLAQPRVEKIESAADCSFSDIEQIPRLNWKPHRDYFDEIASVKSIFRKFGIKPDHDLNQFQKELYYELVEYDYGYPCIPNEISDLNFWNLEQLCSGGDLVAANRSASYNKIFRKPKIAVRPFETSKGNLSVI